MTTAHMAIQLLKLSLSFDGLGMQNDKSTSPHGWSRA